jgi:hypothetical protein
MVVEVFWLQAFPALPEELESTKLESAVGLKAGD